MRQIIVGIFCFFSVFLVSAETTQNIPVPMPSVEVSLPIAPSVEPKIAPREVQSNYDDLIQKYAEKYDVSEEVLHKVIFCESRYNRYAIGDRGHSRGLVQIYDNYHPTITHEQAFDPDFAINFLAENIKKGKGNMWTCFRNI